MEERRRFVRHPLEFPLTYKVLDQTSFTISQTTDMSDFGISFLADEPLTEGQLLELDIHSPKKLFHAKSIVKWQNYSSTENKYRIGVMFVNRQEGFHARMLEQICQIDLYHRYKMQTEKREIPYNEVAFEWINLYGKSFAEGVFEYNY